MAEEYELTCAWALACGRVGQRHDAARMRITVGRQQVRSHFKLGRQCAVANKEDLDAQMRWQTAQAAAVEKVWRHF